MAINDRFMLPYLVRSMAQMRELLAAEQAELDLMLRTIAAWPDELTVSTCTALLARYEALLDISADAGSGLEDRRSAVVAKLNAYSVATPAYIKELAEAVIGGSVEVKEFFSSYIFRVSISVNEAPNSQKVSNFREQLEQIKPAHLLAELVVALQLRTEHRLYMGFAQRVGRHITVGCAVPASLEVTYTTDENGNLLSDENGARIID